MSDKSRKTKFRWIKVSELFEEVDKIKSCNEIKEKFPGYEGLWCKLIMAVTSYAMTNNSVAVIHGPSNCGWAVRNFTSTNYSLYYGNPFLHMPCTDVSESEIISGANESLIKTLVEVDENYKPEHICVFDTCSTALIGDDVKTCILEAQKLCKAKINYISAAGLSAPYLGKSIEETSVQYIDMMDPPEKVIDGSVNVLGQYKESFCRKKKKKRGKYPDDASELLRYIEALGLNIHRVIISGNIDYVKTAPQAAINVISCPTWGIPLAKKMYEKFKTPYLKHSVPIGIESTSRWIKELASFFGRQEQAENLIKNETNLIKEQLEKTKDLVKNKVALIECGRNSMTAFARPMALARMLQELGMIPYLFGLHPLELKAKKMDFDYFMWEGFDPYILYSSYAYQQPVNINSIINDLDFDNDQYVYFTEDVFPMAKAGYFDASHIPRVETGVHLRRIIDSPGRGTGFRGTSAILKSITEAIKASKRKNKPTLYARVHGEFWNYNENT